MLLVCASACVQRHLLPTGSDSLTLSYTHKHTVGTLCRIPAWDVGDETRLPLLAAPENLSTCLLLAASDSLSDENASNNSSLSCGDDEPDGEAVCVKRCCRAATSHSVQNCRDRPWLNLMCTPQCSQPDAKLGGLQSCSLAIHFSCHSAYVLLVR